MAVPLDENGNPVVQKKTKLSPKEAEQQQNDEKRRYDAICIALEALRTLSTPEDAQSGVQEMITLLATLKGRRLQDDQGFWKYWLEAFKDFAQSCAKKAPLARPERSEWSALDSDSPDVRHDEPCSGASA